MPPESWKKPSSYPGHSTNGYERPRTELNESHNTGIVSLMQNAGWEMPVDMWYKNVVRVEERRGHEASTESWFCHMAFPYESRFSGLCEISSYVHSSPWLGLSSHEQAVFKSLPGNLRQCHYFPKQSWVLLTTIFVLPLPPAFHPL